MISGRQVLSALILASAAVLAGPIHSPTHPNYTSQFTAALLRVLDGNLSGLPQQFPQNLIVYQPPLIGYLSPVNPAQWIVWTTIPQSAVDPFQLANLNGFPPSREPAVEDQEPIPEPASLTLALAGLGALYHRWSRRRRRTYRRMQPHK